MTGAHERRPPKGGTPTHGHSPGYRKHLDRSPPQGRSARLREDIRVAQQLEALEGGVPSETEPDAAAQAEAIIRLTEGVLTDQVVLVYALEGEGEGETETLWCAIDLREPEVWREQLAERIPGRVRIRTWSGRNDRDTESRRLTEH